MRDGKRFASARDAAMVLLLAVLASCTTTRPLSPDVAALPLLSADEKTALESWLVQNPDLRPANAADCRCDDAVREMQSSGQPAYQPDVRVGDFNGDGAQDFAILLAARNDPNASALAIFNGPFDGKLKSPAFVMRGELLAHVGLFEMPNDHRLLVGHFDSEGCAYTPKGATYQENCDF
jgi:hypothetical protein